MNRQTPRAFTLVELLVTMAIIGILLAEVLPAVESAREVARRSECSFNLQRLVGAVQSYQNSQTYYPAGVTDTAGPIQNRPQGMHHNWILRVLPYLDERVTFSKIDFNTSVYDKKHAELAALPLPGLLCPDDTDVRPHSSYAACHNDVEAPIDVNNHGVFFLNSRLRPTDISDGLAYTLFLAEKRSEPNHLELGWMSGTRATLRNTGTRLDGTDAQLPTFTGPQPAPLADGSIPAPVVKPPPNRVGPANSPTYVGGFGSSHPEGLVTAALGDGSIRMLSETIDAELLRRLGNRADGQVVDLGKLTR